MGRFDRFCDFTPNPKRLFDRDRSAIDPSLEGLALEM